jgi:hypothetical protein
LVPQVVALSTAHATPQQTPFELHGTPLAHSSPAPQVPPLAILGTHALALQ